MAATAKRTLKAAEKAMNRQPGKAWSEKDRAFMLRCGLSGSTEFVPNDCRLMNEILNGNYPETMTPEDIADVQQIMQQLEDACK